MGSAGVGIFPSAGSETSRSCDWITMGSVGVGKYAPVWGAKHKKLRLGSEGVGKYVPVWGAKHQEAPARLLWGVQG